MYQEKKRVHYFPESFRSFIKARSLEILGLSLLCGSGVLFLSLLTYDHTDASMNVISSMEHFSNALGLKGAYIADFLMQYLGKTSYILPICIALWGLLTLAHRSLKDPIKRSLAIIGATILGASSISCFAIFLNINIKHGVIGLSLATKLVTFFETVDFPPLLLIISGVFFLGFLASIFYAISLSLSDWRSVLYILWSGVKKATKSLIWALKKYKSLTSLKPKIYDEIQDEIPIFEDDKHLLLDKEFNNEINTEKATQQSDNSDKTSPRSQLINKKENILSLNNDDSYTLPSLSLLQEPNTKNKTLFKKQEIKKNIEDLAKVLTDYGIKGEIIGANPGPVVTLYELKPAPGIKSSRIIGLADDIARSMHAISARIAVVPGKNIIGIELPNEKRQTVYLQDLLGSRDFEDNQSKLTLALGKNICGHPVLTDLARMPHMIVAGTTGSGKSVGINAMILSLLYRHSPETCRLILIDPKMLEFSMYNDIPHLLTPVVTEPKKAIFALKWAVREMENRYRGMSHLGVRNIESYNLTLKQAIEEGREITRTVQTGFDSETGRPVFEEQPINMKPLPYIVVVVDEMADLMMVAGKDIESAVQRLAQMARAAGIHVIMATQRPSVDVITGTIKANFPTRISFQVTSKFDSRTILGEQGAEQLLGRGDMLFMEAGGRIQRIHGPFVSDEEVERIVSFLKKQGSPDYISNVCDEDTSDLGMAALGSAGSDENNELYMKAVSIVKKERKASTSFIQRRLQIGYNRAARIIEQMEAAGIVTSANHVGKRDIIIEDIG